MLSTLYENKKSIAVLLVFTLLLSIAVHFVKASGPRISPERRAALEERITLLQYEYDTAEVKKAIIDERKAELNRLQQEWKNEADGHRYELAGTQPMGKSTEAARQ